MKEDGEMPQTGVSVRRSDAPPGRASEPHLVLARDSAAKDMAEIARSGVRREARSDPPRRTAPSPAALNGGIPGRRTVTITGHGSGVYPPRRRPQRPLHQRPGFQPDRFAMWAVVLGLLLVLIAATSAHP
jgi:hypothetical protein